MRDIVVVIIALIGEMGKKHVASEAMEDSKSKHPLRSRKKKVFNNTFHLLLPSMGQWGPQTP